MTSTENSQLAIRNSPRAVLITGATDGLGLALAQHYAGEGMRLVLVGRRSLAELDGSFFTADSYCQADLALPDAAVQVDHFLQTQGINGLDLVIQNAGIGYIGAIADQPAQNIRQLVAVNFEAVTALTHRLLPRLRAVHGKIVFISSVASALATPDYAVYTATKAALDGFARNLRIEVGDRIQVQVIHPGAAQTGMHRKAGADPKRMRWERFPPAGTVAAQIVRAIETRQTQSTPGMLNKGVRIVGTWLGAGLDRWMIRRRT